MNNALILTNEHYVDNISKTAHGLVRGTTMFSIKGIIDSKATSGRDAGQLLDGRSRKIPVYENLKKALADAKDKVDYLIIGVATKGGVLPVELKKIVKAAIKSKINIVNGLHQYLCDDYDMIRLARANNVRLIDIRKAKPFQELHFWSGKIKSVTCPIVAVLGTDCKMGKRTTAKIFTDTCIRGWSSSLYGPVKNAAGNYYNKVQLKALIIAKRSAAIVNYDTKTGYPLNKGTVRDAIVSYEYKDHPARVLANNMVNRFHVIGTLNADSKAGDDILLILTVEKTTLDNAADQLKLLGSKSDIITIDGGTSVWVYNRKVGITEYPGKNEPQHEGEYIRLPHYIVITAKK